MAVSAKVGSFNTNNATGNQAITGVGFTPKAIIFWASGNNTVSGIWGANYYAMLGFTAGSANSYSCVANSRDNVATSVAARRMAAKAITLYDAASTFVQEADLLSFDSDGFTINWTNVALGYTGNVNYLALGGSDITGAKVVNWTTPTATGNKVVTGVGFQPDLVFNIGTRDTAAVPSSSGHANMSFGVMNKHGQQWMNSIYSQTGQGTSNTGRWQQTDAFFGSDWMDVGDFQGHFASMDTDGFTLNFSNTLAFAEQTFSLCLKGLSSKISAFSKSTATAPAAQSVTHVGFTPRAVLTSNITNTAAGAPLSSAFWSMGASDGTTQRVAAIADNDNITPTNADSIYRSDATFLSAVQTATLGQGSMTSLDADGFSINWTTNDSSAYEHLYLALGDAGTTVYPTKIATGTTFSYNDGTGYSNQRKIDRCQNGNIVAILGNPGSAGTYIPYVSTDNGLTWNAFSANPWPGTSSGTMDASIFIDLDDYIHYVMWHAQNGAVYYMRGTPNAGRTDWTWATQVSLRTSTYDNYPDIIAHREGTGWKAHVILSTMVSATSNLYVNYIPITITSGGTITAGTVVQVGGDYGVGIHAFPSIDFNHIGDGKTVAGSTPHLYTAWSAGKTGAGFGIRHRKATYSAGTWTWGTEREIDNAVYVPDTNHFVNCLFDGTRVLIGMTAYTGGLYRLRLYDRDVADTTTTNRVDRDPATLDGGAYTGSMTYDAAGNVYFVGRGWTSSTSLHLEKWTRNSNTYTRTVIDPTGFNTAPYVSMKRGFSNNRVEWIYTTGNNYPYSFKYDSLIASLGYYFPQMIV